MAGMDAGAEADLGTEMPPESEPALPAEEPEAEPAGAVGRPRR